MKNNPNQICWLLEKVQRSSDSQNGFTTFQQFLDNQQYTNRGILRYEKMFGAGYVSTGGPSTTKVEIWPPETHRVCSFTSSSDSRVKGRSPGSRNERQKSGNGHTLDIFTKDVPQCEESSFKTQECMTPTSCILMLVLDIPQRLTML